MRGVEIVRCGKHTRGGETVYAKILSLKDYDGILSLHPEFEQAKAFRDLILWSNEHPLTKNANRFSLINAKDESATLFIGCSDTFFMFVSEFAELSDLGLDDALVTMDIGENDFGNRGLRIKFDCCVERGFLDTALAGYAKDIV